MKLTAYIKHNYWLIAIMALATFLRLFRLDYQSLWMDEIFTLNITNPAYSLKELYDRLQVSEGFPYLYYYMLRLFYAVFGYSGATARLISALAGIGAVYAIYRFGKHLFNKNVGLLVAFLLAVNEFHILYSQEARPYSLYLLVTVISFHALSVFIKTPTLKNAVWYGLAAGLLLNINFFGIFNLFSQVVLLLIVLFFSAKEDRLKVFKFCAVSGTIAILLFLPNLTKFLSLMKITSFWIPAPQPDSFAIMFKEFLGNSEVTLFIFVTIIIFYIVALLKEQTGTTLKTVKENALTYSFIILFAWFTCFFVSFYIKSYVGISVVLSRYYVSIVPVFIIIIGIGIYVIKNKIVQIAVTGSLLMFCLINLVVVKHYYTIKGKSEYREVSAFIEQNNQDNLAVYTSLREMYDYYLDNEKVKTNLLASTLEDHVRVMMADSTQRASFWYADAHVRPYTLTPDAEAYLYKYFTLENNYDGFDAWTRNYVVKTGSVQTIDIKKFVPLKPLNGDTVQFNLEIFEYANSMLKTSGWAYLSGQDSNRSKIKLVIIKDNEALILPTQSVIRNDVGPYFKSKFDLDNSGFKCEQILTDFPKGTYTLGIYVVDKTTPKESLIVTDKIITIP